MQTTMAGRRVFLVSERDWRVQLPWYENSSCDIFSFKAPRFYCLLNGA